MPVGMVAGGFSAIAENICGGGLQRGVVGVIPSRWRIFRPSGVSAGGRMLRPLAVTSHSAWSTRATRAWPVASCWNMGVVWFVVVALAPVSCMMTVIWFGAVSSRFAGFVVV